MKAYLYAAAAVLALGSVPASAAVLRFTITNVGGINNQGNFSFELDDSRLPDIVTNDSVRFGPIAGAPAIVVSYTNVPGVGAGTANTGVTFFAPIQQGGLAISPLSFGNFRVLNTQLITNTGFTPALGRAANRPTFRIGTFALSTTAQNNGARPVDNYTVTIAAVNAVPEPATWAMMVIGFGAVGIGMRRNGRAITA